MANGEGLKLSKKVSVSVKTKARKELIKRISEHELEIHVKELPIEGKANKAIIKALSKYFFVPQKDIELVSGAKFKKKIFKITI